MDAGALSVETVAGGAALVAALLIGSALGLLRRRRDGRFRAAAPALRAGARRHLPTPGQQSAAEESAVMHAQPRGGPNAAGADASPSRVLTGDDLAADLGDRATLVQFSTAFCQPCRATRRILGEVGAMVDGVAHIEIDAESHLELVRSLEILRTPTVLVLDSRGRIAQRAAGQPRKADVIAALGAVIG